MTTSAETQELPIGELARRAGVAPSAIRYYERRGLLDPPDRRGGKRRYGPEAVEVLAVISAAKEAGFSLDEVGRLLHGFEPSTPPSERWRQLAADKLAELDHQVAELDQMRELLRRGIECGCLRLEDCQVLRERMAGMKST